MLLHDRLSFFLCLFLCLFVFLKMPVVLSTEKGVQSYLVQWRMRESLKENIAFISRDPCNTLKRNASKSTDVIL